MAKRNDKDVREELLDRALKLFAEKGFAATSIRDVANDIGVSLSNIYHYFGNKEGMWLALLERTVKDIPTALREIADMDMDPVERLKLMLKTHIEINNGSWREAHLFSISDGRLSPEGNDAVKIIQREILNIYVGQLVQLRDQGLLSGAPDVSLSNLKVQALNLAAVVNGFVRWFRPDGPMSSQELSEQITDFVIRGVGVKIT